MRMVQAKSISRSSSCGGILARRAKRCRRKSSSESGVLRIGQQFKNECADDPRKRACVMVNYGVSPTACVCFRTEFLYLLALGGPLILNMYVRQSLLAASHGRREA